MARNVKHGYLSLCVVLCVFVVGGCANFGLGNAHELHSSCCRDNCLRQQARSEVVEERRENIFSLCLSLCFEDTCTQHHATIILHIAQLFKDSDPISARVDLNNASYASQRRYGPSRGQPVVEARCMALPQHKPIPAHLPCVHVTSFAMSIISAFPLFERREV